MYLLDTNHCSKILSGHSGISRKLKSLGIDIERLGFRENDIWIAATARRHGLTVVTADGDFRRMKQAVDLDVESWWTPSVAD